MGEVLKLWLFFFGFLTATMLPSGADVYPGACQPWVPVSEGAFGLPGEVGQGPAGAPAGSYRGEEGFEVLVYQGSLYLGMEADNALGARLWRTRPGARAPLGPQDWQEVAADPFGNPFGNPDRAQNDHVDSLAEYRGALYASTANRGDPPGGTRLYRSASGDPGTWEDAVPSLGPGFGDPDNENFKDMQVFRGWLCGGTWNEVTGAQVWCTADGDRWLLQNRPGFAAEGREPANQAVWSGAVFDGGLYFGLRNTGQDPGDGLDDVARLYRTRSLGGEPLWELVYEGKPGSIRADLLGDFDGHLYLAVASPQGVRVLRSQTGSPGSWQAASAPGLDGDPRNLGTVVDGAAAYNGALYMSVTNPRTGVQVWRTPGGGGWVRVGSPGLGQPGALAAELTPFNGELYAWTSNPLRGQGVLRTRCPICQRASLDWGSEDPAYSYNFGELALTVRVRSGAARSLEACFYPGVAPPGLEVSGPSGGIFTLRAEPASAPLTADVRVTVPEGTLSPGGELFRRKGDRWESCAQGAGAGWSCRGQALASPSLWALSLPPEQGAPARRSPSGLEVPLLGLALLVIPSLLARVGRYPRREN